MTDIVLWLLSVICTLITVYYINDYCYGYLYDV